MPFWAPPLLALQFLTRIRVPGLSRLSGDQARIGLVRGTIWFPLVGALVGCVTAGVIMVAETAWPRLVAVILALIVEARLTGAFHEDAVADVCDGLGGGRDAESVRAIMKDSRVGSYGVLGLGLAVALRAGLLLALPAALLVPGVIASACFGRLLAVGLMAAIAPVASAPGLGKDVGSGTGPFQFGLALLTAVPGLAAFGFVAPGRLALAFAAGAIFLIWFRVLLVQRLGGSSGDCLGFAAYAGQLLLLLVAGAR